MIDYKKKYLDALERAKSFQEKYGGDYAGYIFPELRESEEDEKIITRLIGYFESFRIAGVATKWEGLDIQEVITLLKSLRPVSKDSLQTHWKPSEEQIYSLGTVVKGAGENSVGSVAYNLKELYEQLKRLKEDEQ